MKQLSVKGWRVIKDVFIERSSGFSSMNFTHITKTDKNAFWSISSKFTLNKSYFLYYGMNVSYCMFVNIFIYSRNNQMKMLFHVGICWLWRYFTPYQWSSWCWHIRGWWTLVGTKTYVITTSSAHAPTISSGKTSPQQVNDIFIWR